MGEKLSLDDFDLSNDEGVQKLNEYIKAYMEKEVHKTLRKEIQLENKCANKI